MSVASGPNVTTAGLVLAYDSMNIQSYKGPTMSNIANSITLLGTGTTTGYSSIGTTEDQYVPGLGQCRVYVNTIQNNYTSYTPNSNNCCPSLHGWGQIAVSPSTLYTYSIVYKCDSGYTNSNYMYRYEYTGSGGSYVTEGGVFNDNNRVSLGGGWYYAWGTFTTQPTTNWLGHCGTFYYRYSPVSDKLIIAKVMIAQGNYAGMPPQYWPDTNASRSNTQNLLDLTERNLITTSSLTYASDGSFSFANGNYISAPMTKTANISFSVWATTTVAPASQSAMLFNAGPNGTGPDLYFSGGGMYWNIWDGAGNPIGTIPASSNDGKYHNYVIVNDSASTTKLYYDGALYATATYRSAAANTDLFIGGAGGGQYSWIGKISNFNVYNKVLSADEVAQNFNALRGRYNV